jgi:hypothetical protein
MHWRVQRAAAHLSTFAALSRIVVQTVRGFPDSDRTADITGGQFVLLRK